MPNALHEAWELLANVSDGNWETQSPAWQADTEDWRNRYMGSEKHAGEVGFIKWPSTPRWHKGLTITEKIDGTNACIRILDGKVTAQSRKRLIRVGDDNFGFAAWVEENKAELTELLGYGVHFGEWFGEGIQKNPLGIEGKRFALFSPWKFQGTQKLDIEESNLVEFVPVLFEGQANEWTIPHLMEDLRIYGSKVKGAANSTVEVFPGEDGTYEIAAEAEGIIVWHRETQQKYKILLKNDAIHKGQQTSFIDFDGLAKEPRGFA